mmetsp:Transcript_17903/g.27687  ORF Transcript_17903/g.27687 Transcript_17903/m.27687 type:complete len:288 (-) Transcript_17903:975-1838(-)|eukprot:CAMPEP_0170496254 /NCGR_PEP_ID=MMETSP0208-20121228/20787_1 /TAXON_ID=197538 /ORGANISM="Strombidium inclinatum, Strain S3" /LENGTH=287 /DNA_ID=CAMNT_0010772751 /DNA_START=137 /DNA_END=1000 /DNA_ORIENTATION=-
MGDHDDRLAQISVLQDSIQSLLDLMFRLSIESRGGLVEQKDLRLANQGSGDCDSLLLASRQLHSTLSNDGVVALREDGLVLHEGQSIGLSAGLVKISFRGLKIESVDDVLFDCAGEEDGLLLHNSHVLLEAPGVEVLDVLVAIVDGSNIRVIESLNQLNDGRLSAATGAYEGDGLVFLDLDAGLLDHSNFLLCRIGKLDVLDVNVSILDSLLGDLFSASSVDLGLVNIDLSDGLSSTHDTHHFSDDASHHHEVQQEREHVELEGSEVTNAELTLRVQVGGEVDEGVE